MNYAQSTKQHEIDLQFTIVIAAKIGHKRTILKGSLMYYFAAMHVFAQNLLSR